jgi:RND family efflux transporter MFP subunit
MGVDLAGLKETATPVARPQPRARLRTLVLFFVVLGLVVALGVLAGLIPRRARERALLAASQSDGQRAPVVNVAAARLAPAKSELELPGDLQAQVESPVFARADGYLSRRLVDYGDHVQTGQLMAEIETPELDQQISQAQANLAQAQAALKQFQASLALSQANLKLAQVTRDRWRKLAESGVFARQDADEKEANLAVREAEVAAAQANINTALETGKGSEANLRRLQQMKSFARVTAPFEGIVTARNVDVGTLINAGNGGPAREMFRVAQVATLRIFVNVPQTNVAAVRAGQTAELRVQELPGQVFQAQVARTTGAVDPNSRAMLAVLEIPNQRGLLLPGMYAQVKFAMTRAAPALIIPGDALLLGREGTRVVVAGADGRAHFRAIHIAHDFGAELEVDSGLSAGENVVRNPSDAVRENVQLDVRTQAP